ncbi:uncharacterized protein LOC121868263 isoform X1 [Homarus americanus]|uniref:uncharacterized protein LOC121868263 isoform X1 n=1 Tax=Homarus americanus TaxID=6706 RepID=UPI001C4672CA|nr:uncharacterized protein LOC121868263 isoform X1 [Homarus americanus]
MRVSVVVAAMMVVLAASPSAVPGVEGQLSLGPSGVSTPPINIVSVFRFLRDLFNAIWYPETVKATKVLPGTQAKSEVNEVTQDDPADPITNNTVIEKFDSDCEEDENGDCLMPSEPYTLETREDQEVTRDGDIVDLLAITGDLLGDKTGPAELLAAGKWPLAYVTFITITFWLFVLIATPYIITGETITRRDDDAGFLGLVDQQDVLLLLSWLLGEASNDKSCLERLVCLTPTKSSRYISVSSMVFNVAKYMRRWVPYSQRFQDQLHHLNDVTQDGYSYTCEKYFCPTVPEL